MREDVMEKKFIFTTKKVLRVLAALCLIFVFCPSFLVSCSGQTVNVTVWTAIGGVSMYGESVVKPHPVMLFCVIIPVALLVVLFIKKLDNKKMSIILLSCASADVIMWSIFRGAVIKIAERNYCTVKTSVWFVLNVISLLLFIILTFLILIHKVQMDSDLLSIFNNVVAKTSGSGGNDVEKEIINKSGPHYCVNCGTPVQEGSNFCTVCGTKIKESEADKEDIFCKTCGSKLDSDAAFCNFCGTKVE